MGPTARTDVSKGHKILVPLPETERRFLGFLFHCLVTTSALKGKDIVLKWG